MQDHILTSDELLDLATSVQSLPEHRLWPTWSYVQQIKYNGLIHDSDFNQPNLIFHHIELPLIKRLFPPEEVNPKVKSWISHLGKTASTHSHKKFKEYMEMRRYGIGIDDARKRIRPVYSQEFLTKLSIKYKTPFKYKYRLNCRDADLLYNLGIDKFIKLFYDRFYEPVSILPITKKYHEQQ